MKIFNLLSCVCLAGFSLNTMAADFSFDRPGAGMGTGITPVGQLAWEQGLPSTSYNESTVDGEKQKTVTLNGDMLFRTGLAKDLELQLGWQGPAWTQVKRAGQTVEEDGLGDVSIGLKKAIDLDDDKLTMAILAEAIIATGNDGFSNHDDIYSLSSAVAYELSDLISTSITMRYEAQNSDWAVSAVPTIEYKIADKWSGFSELVYRKAESQDYEYALGSGVIYALNDRVQMDASIGVDLNGPDKSYQSGLGVSFLF
ncbi:transporter [Acinetobacter albensis]|uniref:Putative MetA-pathway of phenol degradation n=1 Tax=Acinetobacter albensis TaxID=1673609 RepID=A0A1C4GVJ8_9GAMM|nr:transporter [Acinetobacter albensis]SCC72210.1 Putative MetA-pathway of phenol degradation [Acinetobacter albensis]